MDVARFIRGDLPSKPIESQAGYTQRGEAYTDRCFQSKRLAVKSLSPAVAAGGEAGVVSSQVASGSTVWWSGSRAGLQV